jgi:small subunit ribosomal protein S2
MAVVTMRELLECGVHFGHQTKRWNPKMKKYIFTARNDIHVIDLQKTLKLIEETYVIIKDRVAEGGKVLFVGTKKQAQEAIQAEAKRCGMFYVNQRWLGGTLTNNITIRQSINKLKKIEKMQEDQTLDKLTKKEASQKRKMQFKLNNQLEGIRDMVNLPQLLVVVDTKKEQLAIKEAKKLGIPIIGVIDTNADPTEVEYPIPANDDAIRAIKLICSVMANAVIEGQEKGKAAKVKKEEIIQPVVEEVTEQASEEKMEIEELAVAIEDEIIEEVPKKVKPIKAKVKKEVSYKE